MKPFSCTRRTLLGGSSLLAASACESFSSAPGRQRTEVGIIGEHFLLNGALTYAGARFRGRSIEGLLMNARLIQGVWDDDNPQTRSRWVYPDTGVWDPERNTDEFIAAMPLWRAHGLLSFTIGLQGGSPEGYSTQQPWRASGFRADGALKPAWAARLRRVLSKADELAMAPIVSLFYFGQDQTLSNEESVRRATVETCTWLLHQGWRNVLVEIANEYDIPTYDHDLLKPARIGELIALAQSIRFDNRRLLVGASLRGGAIPAPAIVAASDFVLLHGNGVADPARISDMIDDVRASPVWTPKPILFNEDDHFDFDRPQNNMFAALERGASWGYFDPGRNNYHDGFQCPPVDWALSTERKRAFFSTLHRVTTPGT